MKIQPISITSTRQQINHGSIVKNSSRVRNNNISFQGEGGIFYGMSLGTIAGLAALSVLGGPAAIGVLGIIGSGIGGAYVGDKLEEKISGSDNDKDDKENNSDYKD